MAQAPQALAFRVMRLCRPSLPVDLKIRLNLAEDMSTSNSFLESPVPVSAAYADRIHIEQGLDACGIAGYMQLPQSFGTIYLGEAFCSYISVGNYSDQPVSMVVIKAELATERQKISLYDNTQQPLRLLGPGQRHDFILKHDVKELGQHTLVCSTAYTGADGDGKYLPQYYKFSSANPLSVRTKTRVISNEAFLEASVENCTRAPLVLDYVRIDPAAGLAAAPIPIAPTKGPHEIQYEEWMDSVQIIPAAGGLSTFLFKLTPHRETAGTVRGPLGKLEIRWRGSMGESGRLQTQQIQASHPPADEIQVSVAKVPGDAKLACPALMTLRVTNKTSRAISQLQLHVASLRGLGTAKDGGQSASNASRAEDAPIIALGLQKQPLGTVQANSSVEATVELLPLSLGVHALPPISVLGQHDQHIFDALPPQYLRVSP